MKTLQKYFVFGTLMAAGLIFAGCGQNATDDGGTTDTTESTDDSGDAGEGSGSADNASTSAAEGEFQMVSLSVPKMK